MNRIAIFAHYDRDAVIDEYVLYYLRGLKEVAARILFVSDAALPRSETEKLEGLAELVSAAPHGEYDFGSWKRGIAYLGLALSQVDELILVNDSCYAPAVPFEVVFGRMAEIECDAWSGTATGENGQVRHLNSYFLVFRRRILADPAFTTFWQQVTSQPTSDQVVIQYENRLSEMLAGRGHRLRSFAAPDRLPVVLLGDAVKTLPAHRLPWLKVKLFRDNPLHVAELGAALLEIDRHYPRCLIDTHQCRLIGTADPAHYHFRLGPFRRRWRFLAIVGRTRRDRWWKMQVQLFGVRVFGMALPLRRRQ
jgi:lipopolysaccharide biosynthesis protein